MNAQLIPSGVDLIRKIKLNLKAADRVVLVMAKVSQSGYLQIRKELIERKKKKKETIIILGVDMIGPSSPEAIENLFRLHDAKYFKLLCYRGKEYFHPKFYAFHNHGRWDFLVGSSNLTEEGLSENIEMNVGITGVKSNDSFTKTFLANYTSILNSCDEFSSKQIQLLYLNIEDINKTTKKLNKSVSKTSNAIKRRQEIEIQRWDKLIREVKRFKGSRAYKERLENIPSAIRGCKKTIGRSDSPKVDPDRWNNREVGYFSNLNNLSYYKTKVTTKKKSKRLNAALRYLLDEDISIEKRLCELLNNDGIHHITGMGISHVTDILIKYYPQKHILLNEPIVKALRSYGVRHIPSNKAERYMVILNIYEKIRAASQYPKRYAYLLLDQFMWKKGHKIIYGWA